MSGKSQPGAVDAGGRTAAGWRVLPTNPPAGVANRGFGLNILGPVTAKPLTQAAKRTQPVGLSRSFGKCRMRKGGSNCKKGIVIPPVYRRGGTLNEPIRFAMLAAISFCAASPFSWRAYGQTPFSDYFRHEQTLNPRWVLSEPNQKSTWHLGALGLRLGASGAKGGSDLWPNTNYNGSVLLQPIWSSLDWVATAAFKFSPTNDYMGAGLLLATQTSGFNFNSPFHRFEYMFGASCNGPSITGFTNGAHDPSCAAVNGPIVAIRVEKSGTLYTLSYGTIGPYGTIGQNFTKVESITDTNAYTYIGIDSIRYPHDGQTAVASYPIFAHFEIKVKN
jgi:hypothetical protein